MTRRRLLLGLALLGGSSARAETGAEPGDEEYPLAAWRLLAPKEAGLSEPALAQFRSYVGGRGCVVRRGRMVDTWGDPGRRGDVASAAKPWYAHFLFRALEQQRLPSLDAAVSTWEPRLSDLNAELGHKDRRITWRHLATQTSGYGVREAPGTAFDYNDWQMALFWDTLFLRVYGATLATVDAQVLRSGLTDPLQCEDEPTFLAFGERDRPGRLAVSPRDFARFGLLYLRKGRWNGRQLLTRRHAELAIGSPLPNSVPRTAGQPTEMIPGQRTIGSRVIPDNQTDHLGSYSHLWWTNGIDRNGKRHWPGAPTDTFGAFGHGGNEALVVIPGLDLIVSWNESRVGTREMTNEALQRLVATVT
ncbi:MAG: serine hydrolase [Armatimonadota bacterium]